MMQREVSLTDSYRANEESRLQNGVMCTGSHIFVIHWIAIHKEATTLRRMRGN